MIKVVKVRNVNEALSNLQMWAGTIEEGITWRNISPRGNETLEYKGTWITEYTKPDERVLFNPERDANPFFHFMESMWILDGRNDVETLTRYNKRMAEYSDDGLTFHGAYGNRIRYWHDIDQLERAIDLLSADQDTRRAVVSIWDAQADLGTKSKDIPCNDFFFLKIRDGKLNITVGCRSNDAIWGAYGANAVQFSFLQEFIARALGVDVGSYVQVSDSFHVYTEQDAWRKVKNGPVHTDRYNTQGLSPYPLIQQGTHWRDWLEQLSDVMEGYDASYFDPDEIDPFFIEVFFPIQHSWAYHKLGETTKAIEHLALYCKAEDWKIACIEWLQRRIAAKGE